MPALNKKENAMRRSKWFWTAVIGLPLCIAGAVFAASKPASYTCPLTGEELPCAKCCPLNQGN